MGHFPEIFAQIADQAERAGHGPVAAAARAALATDRPERLLLLTWGPNQVPGLREWLDREAPGLSTGVAGPPELLDTPWRAAAADRVLAIVPEGLFLDANDFDQLSRLVLSRPRGTFRVVLWARGDSGAGAVTASEAGLANLIRPEGPGGPAGPAPDDLLLWVEDATDSPLADRVRADRADLAAWVREPVLPPLRDQLDRFRALELVGSLEQHRSSEPPPSPLPDRRQLTNLSEQIRQCRRRMLETIERGVSGVQRELTTSLNTFERDLLQEVRTRLRDHVHSESRAHAYRTGRYLTFEQVQRFVGGILRDRLTTWAGGAQATLARRADELVADSGNFLQGLDWPLLDDLCARQGLPARYPDALLAALRPPVDTLGEASDLLAGLSEAAGRATTGGRPAGPDATGPDRGQIVVERHWLGALCGGALAAATALWFTPFGLLGAIIGAGAGAIGGGLASQQLMDGPAIDRTMSEVEREIVRTAQQAHERVNGFLREAVASVRGPLESQFDAIEGTIARSSTGDAAAPTGGEADSLGHLREQIVASTPAV